MGILSKPLWVILGALALALAVSAAGVLYFRGEARTLRAELNAVQADLKGLESAYSDLEVRVKARAAVDVAQSNTRAKKAQAVRAVRAAITKETENENDSHPVASPAQLERLRRLTEAANAGIRTASELP
jgi:cell division protein FtsL